MPEPNRTNNDVVSGLEHDGHAAAANSSWTNATTSRSRCSTSLRARVGRSSDLTDKKQTPAATHRESFTEVVILPALRERLKIINPWLEDNEVEEGVKQLAGE